MSKKTNIGIGALLAIALVSYLGFDLQQESKTSNQEAITSQTEQSTHTRNDLTQIEHAFKNKISDIQVQAQGEVLAVLRDDNEGSRHQKFILELGNQQTILVAHNIDLAPRIANIQKGDLVEFFGEYEYTERGGVIHWTHHDPQKRHVDGWLKHQGRTYQ